MPTLENWGGGLKMFMVNPQVYLLCWSVLVPLQPLLNVLHVRGRHLSPLAEDELIERLEGFTLDGASSLVHVHVKCRQCQLSSFPLKLAIWPEFALELLNLMREGGREGGGREGGRGEGGKEGGREGGRETKKYTLGHHTVRCHIEAKELTFFLRNA